MRLKEAAQSFVDVQPGREPEASRVVPFSVTIDSDAIERGAEALFEFVFSACERLDAKHHWADCTEETKAGFRREAVAVLASVWPLTPRREPVRSFHSSNAASGAKSRSELS
jgi:hypothetical protein